MAKAIGILLVISGVVALLAGAFIDVNYGARAEITGRVTAEQANSSVVYYFEAAIFSYSIVSLIMGAVFLLRM